MEYSKRVLVASFAMLVLTGLAHGDDIELYTFPAPPYQIVDDTPGPGAYVRGLTVDTMRCAAAETGHQSRVHAAPPKRATQFLVNNLVDGYFAVDPSRALDQVAFRSDPISLEKWYMVARADRETLENPRIGAVMGSNEEAWLRLQGKDIFLTVRTADQLIALLKRERIDQALMDQRVLESLSNTRDLASHFLRYAPLHAYFSRRFVNRNPGFIDEFNRQIPLCINGSFDLDDTETVQIRSIAYDMFKELEAHIPLDAAIADGPDIENLSQILNLDAQWQALAPQRYSEMARRVADQPASIAMEKWQQDRESLITEIMLTNSIGTLVAMSQLTSDFWQGDEAKFEYHIRSDTPSLFVSPIHYDASTARFQVTVSMPVIVEGQWLPAGVLAIGLDVEQALAGSRHVRYLTDVKTW
jgi:ABC-type amino acid transport substrate-binding protein